MGDLDDLRRELAHRPLVLAAAALCVGLTAALHPVNLVFLLPLLWTRRAAPVALAFVLGLALAPRPAPILPAAGWADGRAVVLSVPDETPYGLAADVELGGHRWRAVFPSGTIVVRGEVWLLKGVTKPLGEAGEAQRLRGIEGRLVPRTMAKTADAPLPWRLADGWRRSYARFVEGSLPADEGYGDAARWLGAFAFRVDGLGDEERNALTRTGTVHLVAASGVHVAALGLLGMALGALFGAPRSLTLGVVFTGLVLYAMATGLHLPTVRACLAFAVGSAAYLVRREPDGPSALALAALVYLPFDPASVYGVGFQLSTVVVGMLVLWPRREAEPARTAFGWAGRKAHDLAAVSLVAALASTPLVALREGGIALLSVPANVVAVPPVLAAIALSFAFHPLRMAWAMPAVGGLVLFAKGAIERADAIPGTVLPVAPFSPYLLLLWYLPWMWFWRPRARPA